MPRRLPPLNSLRAFEAAARHLSFTKAAEDLFVTQAAVSHQVKHLEEFLGVKLFNRINRKLTLTDEGAEYYPEVRDIFERLMQATDNLQTVGASGTLTVSVIPTFAVEWLIPRLDQFNERYPDIDVRITANNDNKQIDFYSQEVDVAIYFDKGNYRSGTFKQRLLDEYLIPLCAPRLLPGLKTPEDLRHHTLLHEESTVAWERWLEKAKVTGVDLSRGPTFSHSVMVLQAAIHGQGVAIGYSVVAQQEIQSGRLVTPFKITIPSRNAYDFVCPKGHEDKPKIAAFRHWLSSTIEQESASDPFRQAGRYIDI